MLRNKLTSYEVCIKAVDSNYQLD